MDSCFLLSWGGVYPECPLREPFAPGGDGEEVRRVRRNLHLDQPSIDQLDRLQAQFRHRFGEPEALRLAISIDGMTRVVDDLQEGWEHVLFYGRAISAYKGFESDLDLWPEQFGRHLESHGPWAPGPLEWRMFVYWHCVVDLWCRVPRYPNAQLFRHGEENIYLPRVANTTLPAVKKDVSLRIEAARPPQAQISAFRNALESIHTEEETRCLE